MHRIADHPSPYLEMHSEDPVDWRPWQADVFVDARKHNRLVFVSVGYFSCHWCHVMHRESYQNDKVAKILNQNFIAVKVDRELDPDLDRRLLDFVERVRGSAGWPLNVFLTPEGYPVTGFTYLPRDNFSAVLKELDREWQQNHTELAEAARDFFLTQMQGLENQVFVAPEIPATTLIEAFVSQAMRAADELQGGFGNTTKFPNVPQLNALLDIIRQNQSQGTDVADFTRLTLHTMASRNLHDHVNGGFFRYTTDPDWQTPHYEKMLYDNAQLARLYLKAHRQWPNQGFVEVATRTLDFVETNLGHPDGGYMASLSAVDDDNKEGGAYFWTRAQLVDVLDKNELDYLAERWKLKAENSEFLISPLTGPGISGDPLMNLAILKKLQQRGTASMPADDKRLASWNAMMLDALTAASDIDPRFGKRARKLFDVLQTNFYRENSLIRFAGNAEVADAVLEDYAQVARAFFNFGQKFNHDEAIEFARLLTERAHALFLKHDRWQEKSQPLIPIAQDKWIIPDLVFFSPMTLWLEVALKIPKLDPTVRGDATTMLQRASREMLNTPYLYSSFIMLRFEHAG
ncbi:MAG: thioredoxin domain-containing protein [Gammaproteobacteria bacterium]|nr:thioredoxin domain-containing protein [Gammaproteobacteria bacterium]